MPKVPLAGSCRNKELEEDCCLPVDSNGLGDGALAFHRFKDLYPRCG